MLHCDDVTLFSSSSGQRACPSRTIELLRRTTSDFVAPDMWPPNLPDLNLVDYAIWSVIQQRAYETRVHDIDELRQHLLYVCCSLQQSLIDDVVDQQAVPSQKPVNDLTSNLAEVNANGLCFIYLFF